MYSTALTQLKTYFAEDDPSNRIVHPRRTTELNIFQDVFPFKYDSSSAEKHAEASFLYNVPLHVRGNGMRASFPQVKCFSCFFSSESAIVALYGENV